MREGERGGRETERNEGGVQRERVLEFSTQDER
jgi:hypothetical protein